MTPIRLTLAQINAAVGDLAGNSQKILDSCRRAEQQGADLVIFPEMALTGYPPEDLLLRRDFVENSLTAVRRLSARIPRGITAVIGDVARSAKGLFDSATVISGGKVRAAYYKQHLPNYGVFDERRYFSSGESPLLFEMRGVIFGVTICEDIWIQGGPALKECRAGAQVILNLSASPYHAGKLPLRIKMLKSRVKECRAAIAYCNLVGGQDELLFDGGSLVMDGRGRIVAQAPQFKESLLTMDLRVPPAKVRPRCLHLPSAESNRAAVFSPLITPPLPELEEIYSALVLGTKDYLHKNGFQKAVVGLSGGIDSSLVAWIAAEALGRENVIGVTMPSRYNAPETRTDAEVLARNLGLTFHTAPIQPIVDEFLKTLHPLFGSLPPNLAEENLQARVRGTLLMALSNKFDWIVLTTGNKSETSVGYSTLYGDTAGGFAVIKDIPKTLVYRLCRWRNEKEGREVIPESVLKRPPTAELRPNQKDQDSLPPYDVLDRIIRLYVEEDRSPSELLRKGLDRAAVEKAVRLIDISEYKRRQAPPGVKITPKAFGKDRRMPITNKYIGRK